jgi:hypothetical protein
MTLVVVCGIAKLVPPYLIKKDSTAEKKISLTINTS